MLYVPWTLLLLSWWWCGQAAAFIVHGCEGNHVRIMCPMPTMQVILIKSAMYGRRSDPRGSPGRCGDNLTLYRRCEADITPYVKYRCEGQPFCEVYVDVATFGLEMCADVRKYAEVDYDCVQSQALDTINNCIQQCVPGATASSSAPSSPFAMKHFGASKAQIPGPATGNAISNRYFPSASAPATNSAFASSSAAVPSPQRAASSSSSSLSSPASSVPSASPSAPALPYSSLSRSIAAAMGGGSGIKSSTSGPAQNMNPMQSAATRANLMNRMRRILIAIRNSRRG